MTEYVVYREAFKDAFLVDSDDVVVRDGCLLFIDQLPAGGYRPKIILAAGTWRTLGIRKRDADEIEPPMLTPEQLKALD